MCCVVRMCCPAPHLQPLLQSRSPSHAVCPQPTLRLLPSVSCTPDPDIHSRLHYRSEMTRSRRKMCKQTGSIVCKVCTAAARRVWELLLGLARFMRSSVVVLVGTVCSSRRRGGGYAKPADTLLHDCRISVSKG